MKVYYKGKHIPMKNVTWDLMGSCKTLVTREDPGVSFPDCVLKARDEAPLRVAKYLRVKDKTFLQKLGERCPWLKLKDIH